MANISSLISVCTEMNINNAKMNNNMRLREHANTCCIYPQKDEKENRITLYAYHHGTPQG